MKDMRGDFLTVLISRTVDLRVIQGVHLEMDKAYMIAFVAETRYKMGAVIGQDVFWYPAVVQFALP